MRIPIVGLIALLLAEALTGCTTPGSGRCIDYVALDSPQQRFDAADVVVEAVVVSTGRTVRSFAEYPLYRAKTIRTLKGEAPASFDLIAPSDQCEREGRPAEYLKGDPLARFGSGVLYLVKGEQTWRLYTPSSLDPLPLGEPLPFSTAAPTSSP